MPPYNSYTLSSSLSNELDRRMMIKASMTTLEIPTTKQNSKHSQSKSRASSGYESVGSDLDIYETHTSTSRQVQNVEEPVYFDLDNEGSYSVLESHDNKEYCLRRVRETIDKIRESLFMQNSEMDIANNSLKTQSTLSLPSQRYSSRSGPYDTRPLRNCISTEEINIENRTVCCKECQYGRLISDVESELNSSVYSIENEPVYEDISDYTDFDMVTHSDTYRRHSSPPPLPARTYKISSSMTIPRCNRDANDKLKSHPEVRKSQNGARQCGRAVSFSSVHPSIILC